MKYKIAELINLAKAQVLTDSFCETVGIASAIIDLDGKVLIGSRWQEICTDFHRVNPQTRLRCIESDTVLANRLLKGRKYAIYECRNGLTDAAAPIVIEEEHIANFFVGQFFSEPPNIEYFRKMLREYGFDETSYLKALSKVPIIHKERIEPILDFLSGFAELIGEMGLKQIRQLETTDALQENEERISQMVKGNSMPIFVIDKKHIVTHWNKACESLTGVPSSKVVGTKKQWSAFYPAERPVMADFITDELEEEIAKYYKSKCQKSTLIPGAYEAEDFFPKVGKSGKWLFFTAAPLKNSKGDVIAAIETVQDITERKKNEEELKNLYKKLKQSQTQVIQLEKLKTIGIMAAGIAHELNNPIMGIINYVQYCLKHTSRHDRRYSVLRDLEYETKRCIDTVQNLLTFAYGRENGKEESQNVSCDTLLQRVTKLLNHRIEKEHVLLNYHIADRTPEIRVKVSQIQHLFLNLISNALDALNKTTKKEINIDVCCEGDFIKAVIVDTGCGIAAENIDKIFEPFFTTKTLGQGTGLGLTINQNIIKEHGGEIKCESNLGAGTKFIVLLPISKKGKSR